MIKKIFLLIFLNSIAFINFIEAQNVKTDSLFQKFLEYHNVGDLLNSESILLDILDTNSDSPLPDWYKASLYNNLCAINISMGMYENALKYNKIAEKQIMSEIGEYQTLADIYVNRAFIYDLQKSYNYAIEYFEKSIRIYKNLGDRKSKSYLQNLSAAYLNIGIVFFETGNYTTASEYFKKSADLKIKHNLSGLGMAYVNIAKTYEKTGDVKNAEEFYLKSIQTYKKEYGEDYYRMAELYFDYGLFLESLGKDKEAFEAQHKSLSICLKTYGPKHTLTSLSFKHLGDHFLNINQYDSALYYYQRSLIAVVRNFNDTDIYSNPPIDSALFDIRLLDNLKSKARALELLASQQDNPKAKLRTTRESVGTIELALKLIDRIRNNYPNEESRIYLAENEKETFFFATELANALFDLTGDESDVVLMYSIAQKAKASVLRNEITQNDLFYASAIPDSLRNRHNMLSGDISAYNNLILQEMRKKDPDNKKISLWKDALFDMNREFEMAEEKINTKYPEYHELLKRTEPVTIDQIRKKLTNNEIVIDYLLSNKYNEGKRKLYIFTITKDRLNFRKENLDSLFSANTVIIQQHDIASQSAASAGGQFKDYTGALYFMFENLIRPVEGDLKGKRLIIIPDEEIARLPFDAFLVAEPGPGQSDYEGLHYLIHDYSISYRYFSSLLAKTAYKLSGKEMVYAFAPDYSNKGISPENPDQLRRAGDEINAVLKLMRGQKYTGPEATVSNFMKVLKDQAIIHLAMHSSLDSANSKYSYLMFEPDCDDKDGRLYNYEISLKRIKSPMVVLSACNSGTGTLYHGEGIMSLARSFILAGASSVVRTSWEVNDETSAAIISDFYLYLSKGKAKDEAMRMAKLDYLKTNPPVYTNPYYWAAYEVLGDNSPVLSNNRESALIILMIIITAAGGVALAFYLRRRKTFSARSL
jgi:CHAT domain-containing protein